MYTDTVTLPLRRDSNPCRGTPRISWSGGFNEPRIRGAPRNPNARLRGVQPHGPRLCLRPVATTMGAGQTLAQGTRCTGEMSVGQTSGTMFLSTTCPSLHLERNNDDQHLIIGVDGARHGQFTVEAPSLQIACGEHVPDASAKSIT